MQLRRPAAAALWKGSCREICTRPRSFLWTAAVSAVFVELVRNPAFERRDGAICAALEAQFGMVVDENGVCVCPSRKDVSARMMRDWRKSTKDARDDAQDSAARKLAQATHGAISESESEDEVVTDNDSESENGDDAERVEGACTVEVHKARLSSETVCELRRLLREHGKPELAVVKAGDIPQATLESESRHAHVHRCCVTALLAC